MRTRAAAAAAAHQTEDDDAPEEVSLASGRETAQLQRQEESRAAKEKRRAAKERRRKAAEPPAEQAVTSAGKLHRFLLPHLLAVLSTGPANTGPCVWQAPRQHRACPQRGVTGKPAGLLARAAGPRSSWTCCQSTCWRHLPGRGGVAMSFPLQPSRALLVSYADSYAVRGGVCFKRLGGGCRHLAVAFQLVASYEWEGLQETHRLPGPTRCAGFLQRVRPGRAHKQRLRRPGACWRSEAQEEGAPHAPASGARDGRGAQQL